MSLAVTERRRAVQTRPDVGVSTAKEAVTFTLSIEQAITDYPAWKAAFDRFADARAQAGVLADRIRRSVDNRSHLVIDLDFATKERAEAFRHFLTTAVWSNPDNSPALSSRPTTRILELASAS